MANRREFLETIIAGTAGLIGWTAGGCKAAELPSTKPTASSKPELKGGPRVVVVHNPLLSDADGNVNAEAVRKTLSYGIRVFGDTDRAGDVWSHYVSKDDIVGIKVNCLGGPQLCTTPAVAVAIADALRSVGVKPNNIVLWDRQERELAECGYDLNASLRVVGTDNDRIGYEEDLTVTKSVASCLSRILTRYCSAQISVPLLKDHGIVGMTCGLKNILGGIHNPNKYHDNRGDPYIPDLNAVPTIRSAQRLFVCDAIKVQYHGGPSYKPQYLWRYNAIIVASDPVALDAVGLKIIEDKRKAGGFQTLAAEEREPTYLATAADAEHQLGVSDLSKIALVQTRLST